MALPRLRRRPAPQPGAVPGADLGVLGAAGAGPGAHLGAAALAGHRAGAPGAPVVPVRANCMIKQGTGNKINEFIPGICKDCTVNALLIWVGGLNTVEQGHANLLKRYIQYK